MFSLPVDGGEDGRIVRLFSKIGGLEEYAHDLEKRIGQLEARDSPFRPPSEHGAAEGGADSHSIDKFVGKNPVDIGKVKPLQIPVPPAVGKHLYSNIISLLLGF